MRSLGPSARHRAGFTVIELVIVLVIAGVIMSVMLPAFSRLPVQRGAANARDSIIMLAARARALAMERGTIVHLEIDPATQRSWVRVGADTVQIHEYVGEYQATISTPEGAKVTVCYTSRGLALPSCSSAGLPVVISFSRGLYTYNARIQRLGRVERAS